MSEEPLNRKNDLNRNLRNASDNMKDSLDEAGDKIKAGAKAMGRKIEDTDRDVDVEYNKEKLKEDSKDLVS